VNAALGNIMAGYNNFWGINEKKQVRMYYGSGTTEHTARHMTSHALSRLAGSHRTLHMQQRTAVGRNDRHRMASYQKPTRQSMRIYLKNNPAKFHPDPV